MDDIQSKEPFTIPVSFIDLGQVVATPGALEATSHEHRMQCLSRHVRGDWGSVGKEDWKRNTAALVCSERILSADPIDESQHSTGFGSNTLWIITEANRSVTTFLLPSEY